MRPFEFVERSTVMLALIVILAARGGGQAEPKVVRGHGDAARTLQRYIQLRLRDADWKQYSKFITWPDEPSWDCKWVVSGYEVGAPANEGQGVAIPVVYNRVGLFCYEFDFEAKRKVVTIRYKLVKRQGNWRVSGPIPDYPEISGDVLIKSLRSSAGKSDATPQRRARALATAQEIRNAISAGQKTGTSNQ